LEESLFVNKDASLATANIKAVNVWVAMTLLTGANFLFGRQSAFRSFNSHPLRPNKSQ